MTGSAKWFTVLNITINVTDMFQDCLFDRVVFYKIKDTGVPDLVNGYIRGCIAYPNGCIEQGRES